MLKKMMIGVSAVVLGISVANSAKAECDGIYMAIRAGGANPTLDDKEKDSNRYEFNGTDLMISGALGYRYKYFRGEFEYIWRDTSKDKATIPYDFDGETRYDTSSEEFEYKSYMFNVYWDLAPYTWFTPYLSAGIGLTDMEAVYNYDNNDANVNESTGNNFTWSIGGGISAKMTNRLNLDVGYRYFDFGKLKNKSTRQKDGQVHNHEFYGGIRYVF